MVIVVSAGEVAVTIEDEQGYTPEVIQDLLARAGAALITLVKALPTTEASDAV